MEDSLQWKTTFSGRLPPVEDDLWWKMTYSGQLSVEDDLQWMTTFIGSLHAAYVALRHFFYYIILFYSKNVDVCKKLELNVLRFDQDMRVLISKKTILRFSLFPLVKET